MQTLDTRTIIVNLLKEDRKTYLSFKRLQKLLIFIYDELSKTQKIDKYNTCFDVNFDAIERTVLYNNNIFRLELDGEIIYLRETESVEKLAEQFQTDETIIMLINKFIGTNVAWRKVNYSCLKLNKQKHSWIPYMDI